MLRSIFDTRTVDFSGDEISAQPGWPVLVAGARPSRCTWPRWRPKALQVTGGAGRWHPAVPRWSARPSPSSSNRPSQGGRRRRTAETQDHRRVPVILSDNVDAAKNFAAEELSF